MAGLGLVLASALVFVLRNHPVRGYEVSWIASISLAGWVIVGGASLIFFGLLALERFGLATVVGGSLVMVIGALPFLEQYAFYGRGDPMSYYGNTIVILRDGKLWQSDFYPLVELLVAEIKLLIGADLRSVVALWGSMQYALWIVVIFSGAYLITGDSDRAWLAGAVAVVPVFSLYHFVLYPYGYAFLLLPMILIAWQKRRSFGYRLILNILLIALPFSHPLVALLTITLVGGFQIQAYVARKLSRSAEFAPPEVSLATTIVLFVGWLISFPEIRRVLQIAALGQGAAVEREVAERAGNIFLAAGGLQGLSVAGIVLLGDIVLLILLSVYLLRGHEWRKPGAHRILLGSFFVLSVAVVALLVVPIFGDSVTFLRVLNLPYPLVVVPWLIAILWRPRATKPTIVAVVLTSALLIGVGGIYPSPLVIQPNDQVTDEELAATVWLHEHARSDAVVSRVQTEPYRGVDFEFGTGHRVHHGDAFLSTQFVPGGIVPDHFGVNATLADQYGRPGVLLVTRYDETVYTSVWSGVDRFAQTDFDRLESMTGVSRVYDAGGARVYVF